MATVKISQLPPATGALSSTDVVAAVQSGTTVKATVASFGYQPAGTGAVATTIQTKLRENINVKDFGAVNDGVFDNYSAFTNAINSLSTAGGKIVVGSGTWLLNTTPTWGSKSIYWDIDPSAVFTGAGTGQGKFPYMSTNTAQLAVGPFIQSQSAQYSSNLNGGIAAFNVEMLQPITYTGQSVGFYVGAKGSSPNLSANMWAINCLINAETTATGTYQCIEVDVDCNSSAALMKGISVTGAGSQNPDVGIEIVRAQGKWDRGLHVLNAQDSIVITPVSGGRGIVIGSIAPLGNTSFSAAQLTNGADIIFGQRNTDTSSTGSFIRFANAANTLNIFTVDTSGNTTGNIFTATNIRATLGANVTSPNTLNIGSSTASSATAGAASALPATPLGYLEAYLGSTKIKFPYYSN
jgi:hypothetical protein